MRGKMAQGESLVAPIPDVVIQRLPLNARALGLLRGEGVKVVSSLQLGNLLQATPTQIRKDLSYFGHFGKRGKGYDVAYLSFQLKLILGLEREWPIALVGVGRLGQALARCPGLPAAGFRMALLFDNDLTRWGKRCRGCSSGPWRR